MCYAVPGKVKRIEGKTVIVDYFGEEKKAHNELDGLLEGDYIYAQGGYVIEKVPAQAAEDILNMWREAFFRLKETDLRLSGISADKGGADKKTRLILDKTLSGVPLKREDAVYLLEQGGDAEAEIICNAANFLRHKYLGNACCVHAVLEISNYCGRRCAYCGISRNNTALSRYRMPPAEIVECARKAAEDYGFKSLLLQSGEDNGYSVDTLADIIGRIKEEVPVLIFISFGKIGIAGLERLYEAGARGILMRFETSNKKLYEKIHPDGDFDMRLRHIRSAREMGYLIITGGLIGLPGQTAGDIADDICLAGSLGAEMYSFGPFLPHPNTPMGRHSMPDAGFVRRVIAVMRLAAAKDAKILITTAFETLDKAARRRGLMSGGNSVMLNATPAAYRRQYDIYPDRACGEEPLRKQAENTVNMLYSLGRAPVDLGAGRIV